MAKGDRDRKVRQYFYKEGLYEIEQMGNGLWSVFDDCIDLGKDFKTLREARQWCREHPADPDTAGKHA